MNVVHCGACIALAALAGACGGGGSRPSPTQPPSPGGGVTIVGNERLGWTETGDGADGYVFAAYVDGVRNELPQAACKVSSPAVFACESPLPRLTTGTHTLQLSAAIRNGASLVEGPKSESIVVNVTGSGTTDSIAVVPGGVATPPASTTETSPRATPLPSCGLSEWDATRVIAWTSDGVLELVDPERRAEETLIWSSDAGESWRIAALVTRIEGTSRVVYTALTSVADAESRLRIARYRELNGILGERAVVAEGILPRTPAHASASFGPDGRLFVAFAWAAPSAVPRPFVVAVDPGAPGPVDFDQRFTATSAVAGTWDQDGRFWIVESAGEAYALRTADADSIAFAAATTIVGIEALESPQHNPLALLAADGAGWLMTSGGSGSSVHLQKARFIGDSSARFDSVILSGNSAVGCRLTPRLTLTYEDWRD